MQWRSAWARRVAVPSLVALLAAGCSQDEGPTGPRIAALKVVSGNGQTGPIGALLPQPLVVRVADQRDVPVGGAVVTFAVTAGNGVVTPRIDTTDASGLAQTSFRLGGALGVQTVAASFADLPEVSFIVNATTAPASKLVAIAGDAQTSKVGNTLISDLTVKVTDAFDNPKSGVPVAFVVVTGGGTVSSPTVLSDAQGISKVKWTLGTVAGTQVLAASAGAIIPFSFTATATPEAASQILVLSGSGQTGTPGAPLSDSIVVKVADQFGNGVGGATVDWVAVAGNGTPSPSTTVSNSSGRTATKWTIGTNGGPMTLQAKVGSVAASVSGAAFVVFESIAAGGRNSCGIDDGGVLYCWGFNGDGQLGIGQDPTGSGPIYAVPQAVPPIGNQTFASMNGGLFHNCAVTFSHIAYCWGDNNNGQVGIGSNTRSVNAPNSVKPTIPFVTVSAGRVHSCGISIGGRGYCWGANERGQLGASIAFDTTTVPGSTLITFHDANEPKELGSPFGAGTYFFGPWDWSAIAAGGVHTCAIRQGGSAYCWGLGREGQLGNGANSVDEYFPQLVSGGTQFDSITAGYKHSCGLSQAGAILCWGDNTDGQLGNGGVVASNTPVTVAGGLVFASVSAGYSHTCGLLAGGEAYCWGRNNRGQLGTGTTASQNAPAAVAGGLRFKNLSAGDFHTCGVTTANVAYCWGDNEYGAIGDGSQANRTAPAKIRFQR